jgi:hypothetical protein
VPEYGSALPEASTKRSALAILVRRMPVETINPETVEVDVVLIRVSERSVAVEVPPVRVRNAAFIPVKRRLGIDEVPEPVTVRLPVAKPPETVALFVIVVEVPAPLTFNAVVVAKRAEMLSKYEVDEACRPFWKYGMPVVA